MTHLLNLSNDGVLRERAHRAIPGGMWGHMHAKLLPKGYPQFFARAEGSHLWDVDGNEYVDLMCSWGPVILGHKHPAVQDAVRLQLAAGDCMNGPSPALVDLAEMLVEQVPHADWAMFQKNGSDATTTCVTIARAGTHRRKILVAKGAYHGAVPWCSPSLVGVTAEDRAHVIHFEYNDIRTLENAIDQASDDLAGIIVTPFRHEMGRPQELVDPRFAMRLRELCTKLDAALILDDVRAGCRIDLGGSWEPLGIRPDLSAWSKAIANGYPLAAVTGSDRFRAAAASIFVTGSFWCGAAAMVAARTTLGVLRRSDAIAHMVAMGELLRRGLDQLSARHGIPIRQTGPVQMPSVMFEGDVDFRVGSLFCSAALAHGAYLHPKHNMFVSAAHSAADIDRVIDAADQGFLAVRRAGIAG